MWRLWESGQRRASSSAVTRQNGFEFSGPPRFGDFKSLVLDWFGLPQTGLMCNLKVILDSQLLLEHQVATMSRKAFAQLHFILNQNTLLMVIHHLITSGMDYCNAL